MALDAWKEEATEMFHWKCPICPNWTVSFNAISDVEKAVNCHRAGCQTIYGILEIEPSHNC